MKELNQQTGKLLQKRKIYIRCRHYTMSWIEMEQLKRDIYLANCWLTAEAKRKAKQHENKN